MGRARIVPRETALRAAMKQFWSKGYNGTTMDDLQKAMNLNRGSVYLHFKGKRELFLEALNFYRNEIVEKRREAIRRAPTARDGIELFFKILIEHSIQNRVYAGCLMTNTATELAGVDKEISEKISHGLCIWEEFWQDLLKRARKEKQLSSGKDIPALAKYLVTLANGVNVMGKIRPEKTFLNDIVKTGLSVLD